MRVRLSHWRKIEQGLTETKRADGDEDDGEGDEDWPRGTGEAVAEPFELLEAAEDEPCTPHRHPC